MRDGKRMKNVSMKELRYTKTLSTDRVTCSSRSVQIHQGLIATLCNSEWPRGRATDMELVPRLKTIAGFQSRDVMMTHGWVVNSDQGQEVEMEVKSMGKTVRESPYCTASEPVPRCQEAI